jgi:hypothetical protein
VQALGLGRRAPAAEPGTTIIRTPSATLCPRSTSRGAQVFDAAVGDDPRNTTSTAMSATACRPQRHVLQGPRRAERSTGSVNDSGSARCRQRRALPGIGAPGDEPA